MQCTWKITPWPRCFARNFTDGGGFCEVHRNLVLWNTVDGRNPAQKVMHPFIYTVLYIPGGAGVLPYVLCSSLFLEMIPFDWCFSNGLKPPASNHSDVHRTAYDEGFSRDEWYSIGPFYSFFHGVGIYWSLEQLKSPTPNEMGCCATRSPKNAGNYIFEN